MSIFEQPKRLDQMDRVERIIFNKSNQEEIVEADLVDVAIVAQIETKLDEYRNQAQEMSRKALRAEEHQSARLAYHLALAGDEKPSNACHAHAIVSGAHKRAAPLRALMAFHKVRIDDVYNGCWLPQNTKAKTSMPERLKNAVPHSRIHRFNYYFWLRQILNTQKTRTPDDVKYTLKTVGHQLQAGTQPDYVMLKKGEGLPE